MQDIAYFAETNFRGRRQPFGIRRADRLFHFYALGKTGTGKSTLLLTLIRADLTNGEGFALFDPHGDLYRQVRAAVPAARSSQVIGFDVPDRMQPIRFNPLSGVQHEVGNVRKCLAAGYPSVLLLVTNPRRSKRLMEECRRQLEADEAAKVRVVGTEELMTILAGTPAGRTVGGYRVKLRYGGEEDGAGRKRKLAGEVVLKSLGRLKKEH